MWTGTLTHDDRRVRDQVNSVRPCGEPRRRRRRLRRRGRGLASNVLRLSFESLTRGARRKPGASLYTQTRLTSDALSVSLSFSRPRHSRQPSFPENQCRPPSLML